jgi:hypothetical protein
MATIRYYDSIGQGLDKFLQRTETIRARNLGPQRPVNVRPLPSGDPAQDVRDARLRSSETRNIAGSDTEAIETVKQIWAIARSGPSRDGIEIAIPGHRGAQRAIGCERRRHLGQADSTQAPEEQNATQE